VALVEGDIALLRAFEIGRRAGLIAALQYRSKQGGANTSALLFWVGADHGQVEVWLGGMVTFDRAHRMRRAHDPR
jgi:hypothetical protein